MAPYIRPFLLVSQTTLKNPNTNERYAFKGLFAGTDLPSGSFLGFYNGDFEDGEANVGGRRGSYVFQLSTAYITPRKGKKGAIDPAEYPLAMCNEPKHGDTANVFTHEFTSAKNVIRSLPEKTKLAALGFYTGRNILAGEELFVHYGDDYGRGHYAKPLDNPTQIVGSRCKPLLKQFRETPSQMAEAFGLEFVDRACYAVYM